MKFNLADNEPFLVEGSSKSVNVLDLVTRETDPVFLASAAANITTSDISNWNSKTDNVGTITGITMNGASKGTSGVVDLGTVLTSHQDLSPYATDLVYNSTRGTIELRHERTTIASIDVAPFIKDGMVSSVTVGTPSSGINVGRTCLIITFNTDAGQNQIELPISQIFDADDYYTKDDIDNAYANLDKVPQVSGTAAATVTIDPYKLYDFGTLSTAMTVSFNTAAEVTGYAKEYIIRFVAGNGCALTLPNGVLYNGGAAPTYVTGRTYEIDIVNNCAAVAEFY